MLQQQFTAKAGQSRGLHHAFVEVGDHERDRARGPNWLARGWGRMRDPDDYDPWHIVASTGMPKIQPRFREFTPADAGAGFSESRLVRDKSGNARAVFEPMILRFSYLGGDHRVVSTFNSLATAAARILSGATDLVDHDYAKDLIDLFRPPVGGVRYVFGEVTDPPKHFISQGWSAGVLQYPDGVLIDFPISEATPDNGHWVLLLHRLGWKHLTGSPLQSARMAWHENTSAPFEWVQQPSSAPDFPLQLGEQFPGMSRTSYYSVLGDEGQPLDVFLASSFAIQILLATRPRDPKPVSRQEPDYSRQPWQNWPLPPLVPAGIEEVRGKVAPRVAILTATQVERDMVLRHMTPAWPRRSILQVFHGANTYFVGRLGLQSVVLCMCDMGSTGRDAALAVTGELIRDWSPAAVIMVGIAFGRDPDKQRLGDVLVADRIIAYEPSRVGPVVNEQRGHHPPAGQTLLNRFQNVIGWTFTGPAGEECRIRIGPVLSGEKLIDQPEFKRNLFDHYPNAIGGEMEGVGLAAAADRSRCEWLLVKGICDWADGNKRNPHKDRDQEFAAAAAVSLTRHVLNQPGVL
jgi:nucleoside phosphorylase